MGMARSLYLKKRNMKQGSLIDEIIKGQEILQIPLPLFGESDTLICENSTSGTLSFSNAFDLVRTHFEEKDWVSQIWRATMPPRFSMIAWRLFHNKVPTDDQLRCRDVGSLAHLWGVFTSKAFSPQLKILWIASGLFSLMVIWKTRNKLCFENKEPSLMKVFCSIKAQIRFITPPLPGHASGVLDCSLLKAMGVVPVPKIRRVPCLVLWHPPFLPWLKLNTDGLAKGNPGPAACGDIFRDGLGCFIGGFCVNLGHQMTFFSELMAIIIGVEFSFHLGWHHLLLESDSTSALACLSSSSFLPP
ncbi:hypothetical protein M0R45_031101 [Rubus argutus]|uniref:Uncharacterized protein n=1 Tax=Rubus argutus TaxID=59490 RepID=A0AAW1WFD8_RUBAR